MNIITVLHRLRYAIIPAVVLAATLGLAMPAPVAIATEVEEDILNNLEPIGEIYDDSGDVDSGTISELIANIIKLLLGLLGILFLALFIYAGFLYMTSAGNSDRVDKAKQIMTTSIIGVTIILAAYIITIFVFDILIEATGINDQGIN